MQSSAAGDDAGKCDGVALGIDCGVAVDAGECQRNIRSEGTCGFHHPAAEVEGRRARAFCQAAKKQSSAVKIVSSRTGVSGDGKYTAYRYRASGLSKCSRAVECSRAAITGVKIDGIKGSAFHFDQSRAGASILIKTTDISNADIGDRQRIAGI